MNKIYYLLALLVAFASCESKTKVPDSLYYNEETGTFDIRSVGDLLYLGQVSDTGVIKREGSEQTFQVNGAKLRLVDDLVIEDEWIPLGEGKGYRLKEIDGNGHSITFKNVSYEMDMWSSSDFGLFGYLMGTTVKDLTLKGDIHLISNEEKAPFGGTIGVLAAFFWGGCLENCNSEVNISVTAVGEKASMDVEVGGLVGKISVDDITSPVKERTVLKGVVSHTGDISIESNGRIDVGGIAGSARDVKWQEGISLINQGSIKITGESGGESKGHTIGGVFGEYLQYKVRSLGAPQRIMNLKNSADITVSCAKDDLLKVAGVVGKIFNENNMLADNFCNEGTITVKGNPEMSGSISGVIGEAEENISLHRMVNKGKIKIDGKFSSLTVCGIAYSPSIMCTGILYSCCEDLVSGYPPVHDSFIPWLRRDCKMKHD